MKRYDEFKRHLDVLRKAPGEDLENEFIISGIIDKFCIQFEMGWKVLKVLLVYEGIAAGKTGSPRDIIKASFSEFSFMDESLWLAMLKDRNDTTHIYNSEAALGLLKRILESYIAEFERMDHAVQEKYGSVLDEL